MRRDIWRRRTNRISAMNSPHHPSSRRSAGSPTGWSRGKAIVTIREATATEARLPLKKGVTGAFTTDQEWRYDAIVDIAVEVSDLDRQRSARANAGAKQTRTVGEDASLADREKVWFDLVEQLMKRFDATFEAQIRKDLAAFIR